MLRATLPIHLKSSSRQGGICSRKIKRTCKKIINPQNRKALPSIKRPMIGSSLHRQRIRLKNQFSPCPIDNVGNSTVDVYRAPCELRAPAPPEAISFSNASKRLSKCRGEGSFCPIPERTSNLLRFIWARLR